MVCSRMVISFYLIKYGPIHMTFWGICQCPTLSYLNVAAPDNRMPTSGKYRDCGPALNYVAVASFHVLPNLFYSGYCAIQCSIGSFTDSDREQNNWINY